MDTRNIDITGILPQRNPMIMISQLETCDEEFASSNFIIEEDNIFVNNGELSTAGILENIAQTCAARIGYLCKYVYFKPICIGYIGAVKKLEVIENPKVGDKILTEIKILNSAFNIDQIEAKVWSTNKTKILAEGEMKISLTETEI